MAFSASLERKLTFDAAALEWLQRRRWPGNVRELRNVVERLALLADKSAIDVRTLEELAAERRRAEAVGEIDRIARDLLALPDRVGSKLRAIERAVLHHASSRAAGTRALRRGSSGSIGRRSSGGGSGTEPRPMSTSTTATRRATDEHYRRFAQLFAHASSGASAPRSFAPARVVR